MATLIEQAAALLELCRRKKLRIATAESCTGGLVAATLTEIPGSSDVVERGFVTYSNEAKQAMLGVPAATLEQFGAVSRETAEAMAAGALGEFARRARGVDHRDCRPRRRLSRTSRSGSCISPPLRSGGALIHREKRFGDIGRAQVRHASVVEALAMLRELAEARA